MARNIITNVFDFIGAHLRVEEVGPARGTRRCGSAPSRTPVGSAPRHPAPHDRAAWWAASVGGTGPPPLFLWGQVAPPGLVVPEGPSPPRREIASEGL